MAVSRSWNWLWWLPILKEVLFALVRDAPICLQALFSSVIPRKTRDIRDEMVLVTGAAQGLGRALALEFAKAGCHVMCVDVAEESNRDTARKIVSSGGHAVAYSCDVTDRSAVLQLASVVGRVDILVNNAGIIPFVSLLDATEEQLRKVMEVNTLSHFWTLEAFLPDMLRRDTGHVVAVASVGGIFGIANSVVYSASKFAVVGLMSALYEELREKKSNVKLSCASPYFIKTLKEIDSLCSLRIPAMEVDEAAISIVRSVREEQFFFTVPGYFKNCCNVMRILPQEIQNILRDVIYCKVKKKPGTESHSKIEISLTPVTKKLPSTSNSP